MGSFEDYNTAFQVRKAVQGTADQAVDRKRPAPRYAIVKEINEADRSVSVVFPGDDEDNLVRVPYNSVKPSAIGQAVKIGGPANDRVVEDTRGPDEDEILIQKLTERIEHLELKAYANCKPTADFNLTTTPSMLPINQPTGLDPLNVTVEATGANLITIGGDYRYNGLVQLGSYRNNTTRLWFAVLPSGGAQYDLQALVQGLLLSSGEYSETSPYGGNGMVHLNAGDRIYINGSNDSGTSGVAASGCRFNIELMNPDPIVRPE